MNFRIILNVIDILLLWEFFHTSVWVWETASLLKPPWYVSVFWSILIMLLSGWPLLVLLFPCLSVPLLILWRLFQAHQVQFMFNSYHLLIRVFHISDIWWSFTGVWVTVSLLKFPGLFSVFWPFSIMLSFGWSPFGRQLLSSLVFLTNPKLLYQTHQSQLV